MCDDKSSKPFFTKKDGIEAAGGCLHECCDSDLCNDGESSSMAGQHLPVVGMRSFDHVESLTTGMLLRPISQCNALPTELSKPHESGSVWVRPFQLHCAGNVKGVGSNPVQSLKFFRSFF